MKSKTKFNLLAMGLGVITTAVLYSDRITDDIALFVGIGVFIGLKLIQYFNWIS